MTIKYYTNKSILIIVRKNEGRLLSWFIFWQEPFRSPIPARPWSRFNVSSSCDGSIITSTLIQHDVQRLLQNLCLGKLNLCVLSISRIDNWFTAHFRHLPSVTVEGPATDLAPSNNVLHELDPTAKPHRELVKELNVLQEVVIRVAMSKQAQYTKQIVHVKHINCNTLARRDTLICTSTYGVYEYLLLPRLYSSFMTGCRREENRFLYTWMQVAGDIGYSEKP